MSKIAFEQKEKEYILTLTTSKGKMVTFMVSIKAEQIIETIKEWIKDNEQPR